MMDKTSGWAWAVDPSYKTYLLHTADAGQTWNDVTPEKDFFYGSYSSFMLDAQTAWAVLAGEVLAQTLDGGQTWNVIHQDLKDVLTYPIHDWYRLRFADANHGWLIVGISAAGAHEFFYETRDGGFTWDPANFETLPEPYRQENARNEIAFWVVTNVIYYDLERFIIAPGDQEGTLEMFVSTDWGDSWKTVQLPPSIPSDQPFNIYDRKIHPPVFFDSQNGVLAVTIWDGNTNATQLSVYGTSDRGLSWFLLGGPSIIEDTIVEAGSEVFFLSSRDAVLICDKSLCVTHDSGNSWQIFGISIPTDKEHTFLQIDFVDPDTGWLLVNMYDDQYAWLTSHLLKTDDGSVSWVELSTMINP